ncbi:MAG TPA: twin-arginine translocase subunit TatC [Chloroflexota bacterium]
MDNDQPEEINEKKLTIVEHLEELRTRLMISVGALVVTTILSLTFTGKFLEILIEPAGIKPIFLRPTEMFITYFQVALIGGVVLAMPVIVYQLIRFIVPGLRSNEKKYLYMVIPTATLLFVLGILFCFKVILPFALRYLLTFGGDIAQAQISIEEYISFVTTLLLWMGVAFELPLVIVFLSKLNIVKYQQLRGYWKYAFLGSFVIAAIITPTPDPFNQTMVAVPLYLLYEIGLLFARIV